MKNQEPRTNVKPKKKKRVKRELTPEEGRVIYLKRLAMIKAKNEKLKGKITKKVSFTSIQTAEYFRESMLKFKKNFQWIRRGNVSIYKSSTFIKQFNTGERRKEIFMIGLVKGRIKRMIEKGIIKMPSFSKKVLNTIVSFNIKNILDYKKAKKDEAKVYAIDLKRCYWTTLYRLGYIDEKLYKKGLIDEYKMVCNMSIGAMSTTERYEIYENGSLVQSGKRIHKLHQVRLHVIKEVFDTAMRIINTNKKTQKGFLWFLTDCFFVTEDVKDLYINAIEEQGYKYTIKEYENFIVEAQSRCIDSELVPVKTFVKWGAWDFEYAKSFSFSHRNEIKYLQKIDFQETENINDNQPIN